jgi:hypothetical protein
MAAVDAHRHEAADIGACLNRLALGRTAVDPDLNRLGQVEAKRKLHGHLRGGLGVGGPAHQHRDQQAVALVGNPLE